MRKPRDSEGYRQDFSDVERFKGRDFHPLNGSEDLDCRGKCVIVVCWGMAMTLTPSMENDVRHIVMLQRSPTYVISRPDKHDSRDRALHRTGLLVESGKVLERDILVTGLNIVVFGAAVFVVAGPSISRASGPIAP